MIDLFYLSEKLTQMLGPKKYQVYVNTNEFPHDNGKTAVSMVALRTPYGYTETEFDAENLQITLTFDLDASSIGQTESVRDIALFDIQTKLLGWRNFDVVTPNKTYKVFALFEQQPPSNPYVDFGRITQQIVVSGTAQVQASDNKAIIGNDVAVFLDGTRLLKMSRSSVLSIGADNNIPLSEDLTIPEFEGISQMATKTLTCIYTGKDIEDELLKMAESGALDINKIHTYKAVYPNFEVEKKVKIVSVSTQDSVGVYLQYTIALQVVNDDTEEVE